ncbi:hypothetical protein ACSLOG_27800, partial [Escherichia coli]|uniref:hypothetical protein n=1 Tax=Escherichia coli TaxID=562 RepID=UPI003EE394FD
FKNELLISQEIIFAFTVNCWIITPPINFMRSNTCNLFHTRTHGALRLFYPYRLSKKSYA